MKLWFAFSEKEDLGNQVIQYFIYMHFKKWYDILKISVKSTVKNSGFFTHFMTDFSSLVSFVKYLSYRHMKV